MKGQYLPIFSIQLARSAHKAAFLLFQETIACAGLQQQSLPGSPAAAWCWYFTKTDSVLIPRGLAWEGERNTNAIWEINLSFLLVFSHLFCLHFLCLASQQIYVGTSAETANVHASYRLRTCRKYSKQKE